jgi:NADH:ubiquinone reductase (H+-translocating)
MLNELALWTVLRPTVLADLAEDTEPAHAGRTGCPRVVIVGAGFAGLNAAAALGNRPVDVLVLNRTTYHGFWMMLYQVAGAQVSPETIATPVRTRLRRYRNVRFQQAEVRSIDPQRRLVLTDDEAIGYDYLVLAAGSATDYFGQERYREATFSLHDLDEAERLRDQLLRAFERAAREHDPARRAALMRVVLVGGGPTGVELAGAFAELIHGTLTREYPTLDMREAQVLLIEAGEQLLSGFAPGLQRSARRKLDRLGVEVLLGTRVINVETGSVRLADGRCLEAETIVWAAGARAVPLGEVLGTALGRAGRVRVTPTLSLPDRPEVFVAGDMAYLLDAGGNPYPMVAQVAMQMGKQAGRNILAHRRGKAAQPFRYFDFGQLAMVGRGEAELDSHGLHLSALLGWLIWLGVHIFYLPGLRNRAVALLSWLATAATGEAAVRASAGCAQVEREHSGELVGVGNQGRPELGFVRGGD